MRAAKAVDGKHNLEVIGSNPVPATNKKAAPKGAAFLLPLHFPCHPERSEGSLKEQQEQCHSRESGNPDALASGACLGLMFSRRSQTTKIPDL